MNGRIPEFQVVEYTQEEYISDMKQLLKEKGLRKAVEEFCNKIEKDATCLSYGGYRSVQEYLKDIMVLIELYEEGKFEALFNPSEGEKDED